MQEKQYSNSGMQPMGAMSSGLRNGPDKQSLAPDQFAPSQLRGQLDRTRNLIEQLAGQITELTERLSPITIAIPTSAGNPNAKDQVQPSMARLVEQHIGTNQALEYQLERITDLISSLAL